MLDDSIVPSSLMMVPLLEMTSSPLIIVPSSPILIAIVYFPPLFIRIILLIFLKDQGENRISLSFALLLGLEHPHILLLYKESHHGAGYTQTVQYISCLAAGILFQIHTYPLCSSYAISESFGKLREPAFSKVCRDSIATGFYGKYICKRILFSHTSISAVLQLSIPIIVLMSVIGDPFFSKSPYYYGIVMSQS